MFGSLDPQDFTVQLQQSLRSQAQPHLLPFLRKTLPSLRQALSNGTQTIEGIGTAEDYEQEMAAGGGQPLLPSKLEVRSCIQAHNPMTSICFEALRFF